MTRPLAQTWKMTLLVSMVKTPLSWINVQALWAVLHTLGVDTMSDPTIGHQSITYTKMMQRGTGMDLNADYNRPPEIGKSLFLLTWCLLQLLDSYCHQWEHCPTTLLTTLPYSPPPCSPSSCSPPPHSLPPHSSPPCSLPPQGCTLSSSVGPKLIQVPNPLAGQTKDASQQGTEDLPSSSFSTLVSYVYTKYSRTHHDYHYPAGFVCCIPVFW